MQFQMEKWIFLLKPNFPVTTYKDIQREARQDFPAVFLAEEISTRNATKEFTQRNTNINNIRHKIYKIIYSILLQFISFTSNGNIQDGVGCYERSDRKITQSPVPKVCLQLSIYGEINRSLAYILLAVQLEIKMVSLYRCSVIWTGHMIINEKK